MTDPGPLATPQEWCDLYGMEIRDPDGWRGRNAPTWDQPIGLAEFWERLGTSTARQLNPRAFNLIRRDLDALAVRDSQPAPVPNDLPHVADLVIADIRARKAHGLAEYGTPLQPRNGRSALRDLYEELLDGAQYLAQALWEQDHPVDPAGFQYRAIDPMSGDVHEISEGLAGRGDWSRVERRPLYAGPWESWEGSPEASETAGAPAPPALAERPPETLSAPIEVRVADLSVLDLSPGDVIVLRTAGNFDEADARAIQDRLGTALPPGHQVLILEGALEVQLLRPLKRPRPDPCPDCKHGPSAHRPTTGCVRCTCNHGRTPTPEE